MRYEGRLFGAIQGAQDTQGGTFTRIQIETRSTDSCPSSTLQPSAPYDIYRFYKNSDFVSREGLHRYSVLKLRNRRFVGGEEPTAVAEMQRCLVVYKTMRKSISEVFEILAPRSLVARAREMISSKFRFDDNFPIFLGHLVGLLITFSHPLERKMQSRHFFHLKNNAAKSFGIPFVTDKNILLFTLCRARTIRCHITFAHPSDTDHGEEKGWNDRLNILRHR